MARRRELHSFEALRGKLGSSEEIRVGAYARRQLRRRVLMGVFGALLIVGAWVLYRQLRPHGSAGAAERYAVRVRCVSCGHTATVWVPFAQSFPIECPACKALCARPLWRCLDCGAEFVPEQEDLRQRCPQCGSERVGAAATP